MTGLEKFRWKMSLTGQNQREENILNSRMLLHEVFYDDSSYTPNVYKWVLGKTDYTDPEEWLPIRFYERTHSAAQGTTWKFQSPYHTQIKVGDIVLNKTSGEYLLCTESRNLNAVHWEGRFTLCNWILRWQKRETGEILEYPCYEINSTQYNSGETTGRLFTLGSAQHLIKLPCDENTVKLDTPQRFMLDKNAENPSCYIVTQNDTTSENYDGKGIVRVTVFQSEYNPQTDNAELGICDYVSPESLGENIEKQTVVSRCRIAYETTVLKSGGDAKLYTAHFYNADGDLIEDMPCEWSAVCDFADKITMQTDGALVWLSVDNDELIDESFKLVVNSLDGQYEASLLIRIESLL